MRRTLGGLAVVMVLLLSTSTAGAVPLSWSFNFSAAGVPEGAGGGIPNSPLMNEVTYKAETYTVFSGFGAPGNTFYGLSLIRPTGFFLSGGSVYIPMILAGYDISHQITGLLSYVGVQGPVLGGTQSFTITAAALTLFFDAGLPFTDANFNTPSTFADGTAVESGFGSGEGTNDLTIANSASKIFFGMLDLMPFQLLDGGVISFATAASDNDACGVAGTTCGSATLGAFQAVFTGAYGAGWGLGIDPSAFGGLIVHTGSDGSFTKEAVPAPLSVLLLGVGVLGLAIAGRYRSLQKS